MNVIITGATGYIGTKIVEMLFNMHDDVKILTINRDIKKAEKLLPFSNCIHKTINDVEDIINFKPEIVIHLATLSTSRFDTEIIDPIIEANISFGVKLLDIVTKAGTLKNFINFGTFAEYRLGNNKNSCAYLYSASKSAFKHFLEFYADTFQFGYTNIIPYTVYGGNDPNKKLIDYIVDSIDKPGGVDMTKGEQILDFIHVDDIIDFFHYLFSHDRHRELKLHGEEIHLGTGVGTRVKDLASMIENQHNVSCNINWGALQYRPLDIMYAIAPEMPKQDLGHLIMWRPKISIQEGISRLKIKSKTNKKQKIHNDIL